MFMKDYWREDSSGTEPEADIYRLLKSKGVTEHIAEMEIGGDIPALKTRSQEPMVGTFAHPGKQETPLQGHRIFLKTLAVDLENFLTAKCLVTCVADAVEGES